MQLFSGGSLVLVLVPAMRILHRTVAVLLLRRNIVPSRVEQAAWISTIHEKLDVYKCSLEFFALTRCVLPRLPRGEREIRDQLRRAALSISLNIAEGTGKPTWRGSFPPRRPLGVKRFS